MENQGLLSIFTDRNLQIQKASCSLIKRQRKFPSFFNLSPLIPPIGPNVNMLFAIADIAQMGNMTLDQFLITGCCHHFNGLPLGFDLKDKVCAAGVEYRQLVGGPDFGWAARIPCFGEQNKEQVSCEHYQPVTEEEIQAEIRERIL